MHEDQHIDVKVPKGDMIVGYVATFKVLAQDGSYYWATRSTGVNDMEALGLAHDMVGSFSSDLKRVLPDDD